MLNRSLVAFAAFAVVLFAFTGSVSCGASGATGGTGGGGADAELTCDAAPPATSFSKVYADVFVPACNSCHQMNSTDGSGSYGVYATEASAFTQVGKTSLYAGTEKMLKVVEAGNLGNSALYLKVLGRAKSPSMKNVGGQMPLGAAALSATQKQLLKDWICSGAKM